MERAVSRLRPMLALAMVAALGCGRTPLLAPDAPLPCVALEQGLSMLEVSAEVTLDRTDILLLIDNSGSMNDELRLIENQLTTVLVPEIRDRVSDPAFGVATFSDFGETLTTQSHAYRLRQEITQDVDAVLAATRGIKLEHGGDAVESQLEALYQVATGEGLGALIDAHSCPPGTRAGVCFRDGSFALVMLFTDAPMRGVTGIGLDGLPTGAHEFDPFDPQAPFLPRELEYEDVMAAIQEQQIRVLGLWSGAGDGKDDMRRVVRDSGAVDTDGQPIVFDIGPNGQRLGTGVVETLELLTGAAALDVGAWVEDADLTDDIDARELLVSVRAVAIEPASYGRVDARGDRFLGVRPGAEVRFELTFDTSSLPESLVGTAFGTRIGVSAADGTILTDEHVELIVEPPGQSCE